MKPTLLIDVSNLSYRALHTTGSLSFGESATGVLYGVFRDIVEFTNLFDAERVAFCFDGGHDHRTKIYQGYKEHRRRAHSDYDEEELLLRRDLRKQIYRLRNTELNRAGFRNIFWQEGYEADDVIAWVCEHHTYDFIIVSSDQDLYQCLSGDRVIIYNPISKKAFNEQAFTEKFGITPTMWSHVKAIAGCPGDGVRGIKGIGEKTAAKYLAGNLKPSTKAYEAIVSQPELIARNLQLVSLPMEGCGPFDLHDDDVTTKTWNKVVSSWGMESLTR
jgi:DNA polymerase-1